MGSHTSSIFKAWCLPVATFIQDIFNFDEYLRKITEAGPKQSDQMVKSRFLKQ